MNDKKEKLNLAIITDYAAPYGGNFLESLMALETQIVKQGGKVIYLFPEKAKDIKWIKRYQTKGRMIKFLPDSLTSRFHEMKSILKAEQITIVHSHFTLPKTQVLVKLFCKLERLLLVQHFHNHFEVNGTLLKKVLITWAFKGNQNIGCSYSVTESIPYKKKRTVCNAINYKRLDVYDENYKFSGATEKTTIFLMFGFDYKRKGVDLAIWALDKLKDKYPLKLKIVVSVKEEAVKEQMEAEFGKVPEWVEIMPPREDVATYYKAADVFLSPSREEGLCYSVLEAIYCDDVVICSNIKGHPLDVPNLLIFDSEKVNDLIKKCESTLIENKKREMKRSKEYVIKEYSLSNWVSNILDSYKEYR